MWLSVNGLLYVQCPHLPRDSHDHSRGPCDTEDRVTIQPQAGFPQSLMGTGSREISQPWSLRRGAQVPSKEGEEGAALPRAARHLCKSHVTTEAPPDSKMGPCWVYSAPGTTLHSRDASALLLKLLFPHCLSCN